MIEKTYQQIKKLNIKSNIPLVIVDADEVIVHFAKPFVLFLKKRGFLLELNGYTLSDSIKNIETNKIIKNTKSQKLVIDFIKKETKKQPLTKGALQSLNIISNFAQVIILTNVPQYAYEDRILNFKNYNISFPVIINEGPKGPALLELCKTLKKPAIFIDDNLSQIESAEKFVPKIYRFHFTGCELVQRLLPKSLAATHNPKSWKEVEYLCKKLLI